MIHLFGNKLKELRKNQNLSQEELGVICNVAKQTISNWENNITQPPLEIVTELATYFHVTTDYLLGMNLEDADKLEKLRIAMKEAGMLAPDNWTIEELEKALQIVEMMRERK